MINKNMLFEQIYNLINKLLKTIMYNILYIYIVYSFYEDNNRILVIFSMCPEKN